jgi:hypothetical protein
VTGWENDRRSTLRAWCVGLRAIRGDDESS